MKVVYLASPYSHDEEYYKWANLVAAHHMCRKIWYAGFACISPVSNSFMLGDNQVLTPDVWYAGDLEILKRCDAVFMNDGWQKSAGCQAEMEFAKEQKIPVFDDIEAMKMWREMTHNNGSE